MNEHEEETGNTVLNAKRSDADDSEGRRTVFGCIPVRTRPIRVTGGDVVFRKARIVVRTTPED